MRDRRGGYIGNATGPAASGYNSAASGMWTLREAESLRRAGTWPTTDFVPTALSGLQLWLDASDASTLYGATSGGSLVAADGSVARWEDKSGNSRHFTQSTSANRPTRKTSQQNSKDTLLFDGSNDFLEGTDFFDADSGGITVFLVYKRNVSGVRHDILTKTNTNSVGWLMYQQTDNAVRFFVNNDGNNTMGRFTSSAVDASSYSVLTLTASPSDFHSSSFFKNGTAISMASTAVAGSGAQQPVNTSGIVRLGVQEYQSEYYFFSAINVAELVMYSSALSSTDRSLVERYLLSKWGIS